MKRVVRFLILLAVVAAPVIVPAEAFAQRRVVRRPASRPVVHVSARPHYYNYYRPYYRPYYYAPFGLYGGYAGWSSWYGGYPFLYAQYPYPRYYPRYYDYSSAARLQVEPRHAEVFIDGYFVGTVDDFDGWLQRLNVAPGEHELTVYLKGYRTFRQNVLFRPGSTLKIEHVMQPLAAGDPEEPRPVASGRAPRAPSRDNYPPDEDQPQDPSPRPWRSGPVPASRRPGTTARWRVTAVRLPRAARPATRRGSDRRRRIVAVAAGRQHHAAALRRHPPGRGAKGRLSHLRLRGPGAPWRYDGAECEFDVGSDLTNPKSQARKSQPLPTANSEQLARPELKGVSGVQLGFGSWCLLGVGRWEFC